MSCDFTKDKAIPTIETFDELVAHLRVIFDGDAIDVDYVQNLLLSYKSNPIEWKKFAHFDKHKYTRNLVDKGNGKYNLMLVCWSEGQGSSIHDHSNSHCFMKMLSGSLHEIRFEWPDGCKDGNNASGVDGGTEMNNNFERMEEMKILDENQVKANDVVYINDSIGLHRVENRSHTYPAVSLHLYVPPYNTCQMFDQRTGHKNEVKVTFYSKYGLRTQYKTSNGVKNFNEKRDKNCVNSVQELIEYEKHE